MNTPEAQASSRPGRAGSPCLLALDTATDTVHLGLLAQGVERLASLEGGARASATLLPTLSGLMQQAGRVWADLDALAFGRGPGAFTGLRTAAAVTQGLAFGAERPVIVLDTLMAVAEDARRTGADARCVWVANDARMGEVYAAAYAFQADRWQTLAEPALMTPQAWLAELASAGLSGNWAPRPSALAGNAWRSNDAALSAALQAAASHAPVWSQACPSGAALLTLALQAWGQGLLVDAAQALPLYVRDKVAQTTAERLQEREAKERAARQQAA